MKVPLKVDDKDEELWYDVGDDKARMKASQCLREKTPDVLPYIKMLKNHNSMQEGLTAPISISIPCNTNQYPVSIPTIPENTTSAGVAADGGGETPTNPCINPISSGFLPIAPSMRVNFPRYLLNYQQNLRQKHVADQDQIPLQEAQKESNKEGSNTSDFVGTGQLGLPNANIASHMNKNNAPTATQFILSTLQTHHQQQLPPNMNIPPALYSNNSYIPRQAILPPHHQQIPLSDNNNSAETGNSSSSISNGRNQTASPKTIDKLPDLKIPIKKQCDQSKHNNDVQSLCIESNIEKKTKLLAEAASQ